jgi:aryl-alcohol dehydrogenase-like predicted oxidoreductase
MAAKNKKISSAAPRVSREDSDLQDLIGLHFQASRRVEEVLEQVEELKSAGKITEARVMLMHAQGIQQGLRALEAEVRMSTREAANTRT